MRRRKVEKIKQAVNIYQVSKGGDGPVNKIPGDAAGLPSITTVDSASQDGRLITTFNRVAPGKCALLLPADDSILLPQTGCIMHVHERSKLGIQHSKTWKHK